MTQEAKVLDDDVHAEIVTLCAKGDELLSQGRFGAAQGEYVAALKLLPKPMLEWEAAAWILAAIGDACALGGWWIKAEAAFEDALKCPGSVGNAFLHMRLGQAKFELEKLDQAADELIRAYALEGPEFFVDEDPKYLKFLATRARDIEFPASRRT